MNCENCAKLQARIAELEAELQIRDEEFVSAEERMCRANQKAREATQQLERHKREADDGNYFRQDVAHQIARARERGDEVGVERGLEKLRRGW